MSNQISTISAKGVSKKLKKYVNCLEIIKKQEDKIKSLGFDVNIYFKVNSNGK